MAAQLTSEVERTRLVYEQTGLTLVTSKLTPPFVRTNLVERHSLLDRLGSDAGPVVTLTAPAGYGKTTLLRQWADRSARRSAWVSLDGEDNDPVVLLTYLATALDRIAPLDPELWRRLAVEYPSVASIARRLANAVATWSHPVTLVLDDVHMVENPACRDIVTSLVTHAAPGSRIGLGSRGDPPLPVARMRAEGRLVEIGPQDLALDHAETARLLENVGAALPEADVRRLVDTTEGWPVAVYLAGRSMAMGGAATKVELADIGRSRAIVEYAHTELLSSLPGGTVRFLTRSSVLDRMSGPLCDHVLRTFDSATRLEDLARSNLLVAPLDEHRGWYRYHHLFRDLLRTELERREPDLVGELQRRAARWCETHGLLDAAVEYAMATGDAERAARIVEDRGLSLYRSGRTATLRRWIEWFEEAGRMHAHAGLAALGAWVAALTGRPAAADIWADAADAGRNEGSAPDRDGASVDDGAVRLLRALLCRDGVEEALIDAGAAVEAIGADDTWRATALTVLGVVQLAAGSAADADASFVEAVAVGCHLGAVAAVSVALAERAMLALDRDDLAAASQLAAAAAGEVDDGRLRDLVTNVIVLAVAARVAICDGDAARAERLLTRAQRLRPQLTYAVPHVAVQARVQIIRTMLALADAPGARTVLREVDDILRLRPKLGVLNEQVDDVRSQLAGIPTGTIGPSSLTGAELRLLPLLQTHLTFREIGERLFVSPHTVKTQAISIYRKLGVSSRSDAMRAASDIGLLPR